MCKNNIKLLIILFFFTIYNLFFINKAVHIDCHATIQMAKSVANNFFIPPRGFFSNPILLGYYYVPVLKLFGESEIAFHFFHLPFSILLIISMFFLSKRFSKGSIFPVLFLISTPAFIVMSQDIMQDIPLLSFFLTAISLFIYGADKSNRKLLVLSGILSGVAILTKYSGLLLIPILAMYAFLYSKKRDCVYLIIPIIMFAVWNIYCILLYKNFIFFSVLVYKLNNFFNSRDILIRTFACLSFISGTSIISIFLTPFLLQRKNNRVLFLFSTPIALSPFFIDIPFSDYSMLEKFILGIFFIISCFIIMTIVKMGFSFFFNKKENKDTLFLSFWFGITLIFTILIQFIAARFILLLFPPMFLLIFKQVESNFVVLSTNIKKTFSVLIIIVMFISTIVAIGDYHFANIYRDIVSYVKNLSIVQKNKIYFVSSGWSYNYYVKKNGYEFISIYNINMHDKVVKKRLKNDEVFIVIPYQHTLPFYKERKEFIEYLSKINCNKILITRRDYYGNVALHNMKFHAGFYSHDWGLLPFGLYKHKQLIESFKIYKISLTERSRNYD